jgi:hypothetical protein
LQTDIARLGSFPARGEGCGDGVAFSDTVHHVSGPRKALEGVGAEPIKGRPVHCRLCGAPTNQRKPFCSDHVSRLPDHVRLTRELDERARESAQVEMRGWRAVDVMGAHAREILWLVEDDAVELAELSRRTELPRGILDEYLVALLHARLVRVVALRDRHVVRHFARAA